MIRRGDLLIVNSSELVVPKSDEGRPLRGKKQGELKIIENGAVLIVNGMIEDFGKTRDLIEKYNNFPKIDASGRVVMPGFIDPHTHLIFAGFRVDEFLERLKGKEYLKTLKGGGGILNTVSLTRKASKEELYKLGRERIKKMINYGTLALEIKSGYGLNFADEVKILETISLLKKDFDIPIKTTLLAAHAVPPEFSKEYYVEFICKELIPYVANNKLADFVDVFCEEGIFDVCDSRKILSCGIKYGLKPKLHTDEFKSIGGTTLGMELSAISLDHLIVASLDEIQKLADSSVIGVILPGTSFLMNLKDNKYARNIIDNNVPLAIGTDFNPGTCMCYSMQTMIELAVLKLGLSIEEAINAATVNASFAICLQDNYGTLECGKMGNFIFLDIQHYKEIPYFWGTNKVSKVIINGRDIT